MHKLIFVAKKERSMPRSTIIIGYFKAYDRKEVMDYLDKHDIHYTSVEVITVHDIEEVVV